jgi:hypothetical protein
MKLKPGVRLLGIKPEMLVAIVAAESIYRKHGAELTITSCVDGQHTRASKHYSGCAFDCRTNDLPPAAITTIAADLVAALGPDFDAIKESNHIHIEYDPKEAI